jgi:hypothetical protein
MGQGREGMPASVSKRLYIIQCCLAVTMAVVCLHPGRAIASAEETAREYQVKAAFIYNFVQFVVWPEDAFADRGSPIVIGVFGRDPFKGALDAVVAGKTVRDRALQVRHYPDVASVGQCHVLFVPETEDQHLGALMEKLNGRPVLTIGESEAFPWAGGIIRFFIEEKRIRFEVNVKAAEKARLHISAKLLKLARIFKG